jgi:putative hydrolase of the HAD superfamily
MPTQPYRGLLLDFGSVITRSFFETRSALETSLGVPLGSLTWTGPFGNPPDLLWQRMLANELSERDYWNRRAREVGELIGEHWTIQEFCSKYNLLPLADVLRPETRLLVTDAKRAGKKVGILTNELELFHGKEWLDTIDVLKEMDAVVDATHTKILKPDPRAYAAAANALRLNAQHIVFIDDQLKNTRGAVEAGMRGLHLDITEPNGALHAARLLLDL